MRPMVMPFSLLAAALLILPAGKPASAERSGAAIQLVQNAPKVVVFNANEVRNERIVTGAGERAQVLFADGTTVSLAPSSEIGIESFSFDAAAGSAHLSANLTRGTFRFIGGATAKTPNGVALSTPHGDVVLDRAVADISLGGDGQEPHFDLVSGRSLTLSHGGTVVATLRSAGYSIAATSGKVVKTPAEWRSAVLERLS